MSIELKVNETPFTVDLSNLPPDVTLNTFIREKCGLSGTKFMCLEGGCGVCVCVVKGRHPATGEQQTWAVNSCLTLLSTCNGYEVTTIEGLGNKREGYHPIQKRLAKMNGTQCGYCSPGFIMNMYGLLQSKDNNVTMEEVENSFGGNICRCTGYRPILDTMKSFAVDSNISVPKELQDIEDLSTIKCPKTGQSCNGTCHGPSKTAEPFVHSDGTRWHWVNSLDSLYETLGQISKEKYMLVGGNTAHGVYRRSYDIKHFVDINNVPELHKHELTDNALTLGGNLSLTETMEIFKVASQKPGFEYCQQLWDHFDLIANVPIRNTGTLAGNFMLKHENQEFPSDIFVTFEAIGAQIMIGSGPGKVSTIELENFNQTEMVGKVVLGFTLPPRPKSKYIFESYKIMPRAQNAHAYVNAAFLVELDPSTKIVSSSRLCIGGINHRFNHAQKTEKLILGKVLFDKGIFSQIVDTLQKEIEPSSVLGESDPRYRKYLACGLFYKFILKHAPAVKPEFKTGGDKLKRELSTGLQTFEASFENFPVHAALPKIEGLIQCSGEALYTNDLPPQPNEAWLAFATAKKVGAEISEIDASEALKVPGVLAFYDANSIVGSNKVVLKSYEFEDEEPLFCKDIVKYYDQPAGMIVAVNTATAQRAAQLVKITYKGKMSGDVLVTVEDVLRAKEAQRIKLIVKSPIEQIERPKDTNVTVLGQFDIGLQYHFSMEPQTTVALPLEQGLEVYSGTQWMDLTQNVISNMCGLKITEVQMKVRRLGGAFGSKISRGNFAACAAAYASHLLQIPVRMVQSIESMMCSLGKRWACHSEYEFHVNASGKILSARNTFYQDAGWSGNESPVAFHSTLCSKNCYEFKDNYKIDGHAVKTDAPSNTWCRAPGSVEGVAMIENIMEHIAFETKRDPMDVRIANIKAGHKMHELLDRFNKTTSYRTRRAEIDAYNKNNRWRKRGLGISFMEYPIFYFGNYPATVAVYHGDGSVVISHGGIEMGQGMNTKVAQVAAFCFNIPLDMVKVVGHDTINGANAMVTGGAVGSESLCYAVRKSCTVINDRLKPVRKGLDEKASWIEVISEAHKQNVNLIASDYYKSGDMKPYSICGLALTEVEIDILTGNHIIKRVDILEDTGESLNPSIDVGQIEGGFVMGLGYWLTEQLIYNRQTGELLTNRTWNYKPPGAKDIPVDFRIELLQKSPNPAGFMRSKATGEPAVCLAVSSIFAIQHAIQSARDDAGLQREWVRLGAPTTPQTIVLNSGTEPNQFNVE